MCSKTSPSGWNCGGCSCPTMGRISGIIYSSRLSLRRVRSASPGRALSVRVRLNSVSMRSMLIFLTRGAMVWMASAVAGSSWKSRV